MTSTENLRDTIIPKSDQLNADDLLGITKTITVTNVTRGSADQPVNIHYEGDGGRPYKPCKSMRRVLIYAWGDDGRKWIGLRMSLFTDPEVKYGGVKVGGIRISHLSNIEEAMLIQLTSAKGKRTPYRVDPLKELDYYPEKLFNERFAAWRGLIIENKATPDEVIAKCSVSYRLTEEQKQRIASAA